MITKHSPAEILRAALVMPGGVGVLPSTAIATEDWQTYVGHLQDTPDAAMCVYDTAGVIDGRIQRTGETVRRPGWQIRVRGRTYTDAYTQARAVCNYLDTIRRKQVAIEGTAYKIMSVGQTGDILSLGQEEGNKRRVTFTINGTVTLADG